MASNNPKTNLPLPLSATDVVGGLTYFTVVIGKPQVNKLLERMDLLEKHAPFASTIVIADSIALGTLLNRNWQRVLADGMRGLKRIDNFKVIPDVNIFSMLTTGEEAFEDGISLYKKIKSEYDNFKLQKMYEVASNLLVFASFAAFRKKSQLLVYFNLRIELGPLNEMALSKMKLGRSFKVALTVEQDQCLDHEPTTDMCLSLIRPSGLLARNSTLSMAKCRFTPDLMCMARGATCASGLRDVFQVSKLQLDQIVRFRSVYVAGFSSRECEPLTIDATARMLAHSGGILLSEEMKAAMNITSNEDLSHTTFRKKYTEAVGQKPLEYMLEAIFRQHNVCKLRSDHIVRMGTMTLSGNESSFINFIQSTVLDPALVGVHSAGSK